MRGVILSGGLGSRLGRLTKVTNKHLLPIYDKLMIEYPIRTLVEAGITEVMVVVSGPHSGNFIPILKNGKEFGLTHLEYAFQDKPDGGIADALSLAENFASKDRIAVILGDNVFDDNQDTINKAISDFHFGSGAKIFLKNVENPYDFGCPRFEGSRIVELIEKPKNPPSEAAVVGLYLFDQYVFDYIKNCEISDRGQLEVTSILNQYIEQNCLEYEFIDGFWIDAGTFGNLAITNNYFHQKSKL